MLKIKIKEDENINRTLRGHKRTDVLGKTITLCILPSNPNKDGRPKVKRSAVSNIFRNK